MSTRQRKHGPIKDILRLYLRLYSRLYSRLYLRASASLQGAIVAAAYWYKSTNTYWYKSVNSD